VCAGNSGFNVTIQKGIGNEFPYLGRVGPAAWAGFRLVGGDGIGRLAGCDRGPGAAGGSSPGTRRCTKGQEGCAETRRASCAGTGPVSPTGRSSRRRHPAPEQQIQLIYSPWTKFCMKGQDANAKQVCFTGKDGRIESGQPVIAAVLIEPEGETKKILRVTLPLGMQLVHGTRVIVDSNPPAQSPYVICFQNGCMSDYELTPELLANLKKGQNLVVQAIHSNGAPLTLPLPLTEAGGGFAKAYDGPPTDPKKLEENNKKLQEELQKRANDARQKLESAQPPTAAAPPNATAK
jgi:invasion protein IalB